MDLPFLILSAATTSSVTVQLPDYDPKILLEIPQIERFFRENWEISA
ncbi:hypothetical protein H6G76_18885 [Nostoc sp. FACHB-152]|nr:MULTISPECIES: hypothetical protein [unclassified Nostoc]MBD2449182.1 hypothetical protein [Nostoc sp. FACHB-152]MBD2466331.1 hypothetical protein [Nostoc sp. FACHB-145]